MSKLIRYLAIPTINIHVQAGMIQNLKPMVSVNLLMFILYLTPENLIVTANLLARMRSDNCIFIISRHSNSGKTTLVEIIVRWLSSRGYDVATIKDIHIDDFSIDVEGKDTWRHAKAGAVVVVARALNETDFLFQKRMDVPGIAEMLDVDIIIVEGCKECVGNKILVVNNENDLVELEKSLKEGDTVLAIAGEYGRDKKKHSKYRIIKNDKDLDDLLHDLEAFAKKQRLARIRITTPLTHLKCQVFIDNLELKIKPYVSSTLRDIIIGFIANLNWNIKNRIEKIKIEIIPNNSVKLQINDKKLKLKQFVQESFEKMVFGYVSTLNLHFDNIYRASNVSILIYS